MELSKEVIEEQKLSEDQVKAVNAFGADAIATAKQGFEGTALENSQKILDGAISSTMKTLGITGIERKQGVKHADFLLEISNHHFSTAKDKLANSQKELDDKVKNFEGSDVIKSEHAALKLTHDELLQKTADYDDIKLKADQLEGTNETLTGLKLQVAFSGIKPNFPDTVNTFEADARWKAFREGVLKDWDLEMVDDKAVAVSKENKHKTVPLSDLLEKDTTIQELLKGREQTGPGGQEIKLNKIEGVPFEVPEGADSKTKTKLVKKYLTEVKKLDFISDDYKTQFTELYNKISGQKAA